MIMPQLKLPLLFLALLPAIPARAQTQTAPPPPADVVVTGERLTREEERERAVAYVRQTGVASNQQGMARWIDPVCPRVKGIDDKLARYVEGRIRTVATAAGAPMAKDRCEANLIVTFVADASAAAQFVASRQPGQLREVQGQDRFALMKGSAPVRWWYSTEIRTKNGERMAQGSPIAGAIGVNDDTVLTSQYSNGIISTQFARAIVASTVVVDVNRASGMKLDAIADYAAFVGLAEVRPARDAQRGSILGMFGGADMARQLTEWDSRFLQTLYRLPLDRYARQQRGLLIAALLSPVE